MRRAFRLRNGSRRGTGRSGAQAPLRAAATVIGVVVLAILVLIGAPGPTAAVASDAQGNWTAVDIPTSADLDYMRLFDAENGVIQQSQGSVYVTSDAGKQWTVREFPISGDGPQGAFFLDAAHGWVCDLSYAPEGQDHILRTVDGGRTWSSVECYLPRLSASTFFVDANVGFVVGASTKHLGGGLLKTTDGGQTWDYPGEGDDQDPFSDAGLDDVFFVDALEGWVVGWWYVYEHQGYGIYHTTDGGATWQRQYGQDFESEGGFSSDAVSVSDVYFVDAEHGWVLGATLPLEDEIDGFVLRTEDGGATWEKVEIPGSGVLNDSCFLDVNNGWVVGDNGVILHTQDGGKTWTSENSGTAADLRSVSFTDAGHGWAVGELGTVLEYSMGPDAATFSDISTSPYREAIESLALEGTIGGYDDGTFRPRNTLLRAQFAKMIDGALRFTATEDLTSPFVDLGVDDPADLYPHEFVALSWMKGITQGKTATTFEPFRPVLRAQAISMMIRGVRSVLPGVLANADTAEFVSTWGDFDPNHASNVAWAEYNGLLAGLPLAELDPWGAMTREEAAQLLNNVRVFLVMHPTGTDFDDVYYRTLLPLPVYFQGRLLWVDAEAGEDLYGFGVGYYRDEDLLEDEDLFGHVVFQVMVAGFSAKLAGYLGEPNAVLRETAILSPTDPGEHVSFVVWALTGASSAEVAALADSLVFEADR